MCRPSLFIQDVLSVCPTRGTELDQRMMTITKSLEEDAGHLQIQETKSRASRRTIVLLPQTCEALRPHLARQKGQLVSCHADGGVEQVQLATRSLAPANKAAEPFQLLGL